MYGPEFGKILRAYRAARGITQEALAENVLGASNRARTIGYVEAGERKIKPDELRKLEASYPDFKAFAGAAVKWDVLPVILQADFIDQQQRHLREYPGCYEMWLVNGQAIPMYESNGLQVTWSENIADGVNYNILWDLDELGRSDAKGGPLGGSLGGSLFQNFVFLTKRIIEQLRDDPKPKKPNRADWHDEKDYSGIDIYGYFFKFNMIEESCANGRKIFLSAMNSKKLKEVDRLRFHPPFPVEEMSPECRRLPIDAFLIDTATVVYISKDSLAGGKMVAQLEPVALSRDFHDVQKFKAHVFQSWETSVKIANLIQCFEQWYRRDRKWTIKDYKDYCERENQKTYLE